MITVKITEKKDFIEILITGHAESRICSAVSALSQTLVLCFISSAKDEMIAKYPKDETDTSGRTQITFPYGIKTGNGQGFYDFFKTGIQAIASSYPKELELEE